MLAESAHEAARQHENLEGYDTGEASAEKILEVPGDIPVKAGWPEEHTLIALGANFISNGAARVVEIAGKKFSEGLLESTLRVLDDDVFESIGKERINGTDKESPQ